MPDNDPFNEDYDAMLDLAARYEALGDFLAAKQTIESAIRAPRIAPA